MLNMLTAVIGSAQLLMKETHETNVLLITILNSLKSMLYSSSIILVEFCVMKPIYPLESISNELHLGHYLCRNKIASFSHGKTKTDRLVIIIEDNFR